MDLTIRDWMVIVGVLLIVAVGLDAWRRVRNERYSRVKVRLVDPENAADPAEDDALFWPKELPNGGARVVQRGDLERAARHARAAEQPDAPARARQPAPPADDVELVTGMSSRDEGPQNIDWLEGMGTGEEAPGVEASGVEAPGVEALGEKAPGVEAPGEVAPAAARDPAQPGRLPRAIDPEVFMLNVVARSREGFRGEDILHILLACDLRFGDMNFFHRHEFAAGRGAIQFSVANMMQPGVFDIDNMADFNTPGLVFFVTLPGPEDMMKAFDYMLETAQAVARNLDGDVLDESRSVLSRQSIEHCRQQIRDLERRLLARTD